MFSTTTNTDTIYPIKVLTAEGYMLSAKYLKILLSRNDEIRYLGNASNLFELKQSLTIWNVDVLLLDSNLPDFDVYNTMRFFRDTYPQLKIVIYSDYDYEYSELTKLIRLGARGYVSRDADHHHIFEAIKVAYSGETSFETQLGSKFKSKALEAFFHKSMNEKQKNQ